jgi:hypothetical protein
MGGVVVKQQFLEGVVESVVAQRTRACEAIVRIGPATIGQKSLRITGAGSANASFWRLPRPYRMANACWPGGEKSRKFFFTGVDG